MMKTKEAHDEMLSILREAKGVLDQLQKYITRRDVELTNLSMKMDALFEKNGGKED